MTTSGVYRWSVFLKSICYENRLVLSAGEKVALVYVNITVNDIMEIYVFIQAENCISIPSHPHTRHLNYIHYKRPGVQTSTHLLVTASLENGCCQQR